MPKRRTADEIVDAILAAARELFLERSPSAVSVREIADRAGINLGLIHRYVGSKDDVIKLVLDRHTAAARAAAAAYPTTDELLKQIAHATAHRPATGRLLAGLILDGFDVAALKREFPLLERFAKRDQDLGAVMSYALALGWEVFGPSLLQAADVDADPDVVAEALAAAMRSVQA